MPTPAARLRPSWAKRHLVFLALVAVVYFFLAWNLWACIVDKRPPMEGDAASADLASFLRLTGGRMEIGRLFIASAIKPPLDLLLAYPFYLLTGNVRAATRLVSVLASSLLLVVVFLIARRLRGSNAAGLVSVILLGACPSFFGWSRMEYREILACLFLYGTVYLMLVVDLERNLHAVALGLVLGLGFLSHLEFAAFGLWPALWFAATRVRSRKTLRGLLLVGLAGFVVASPWLILHLYSMVERAKGSSHERMMLRFILEYGKTLWDYWPLLAGGLLAIPLLARLGGTDRETLALLSVVIGGGLFNLVLLNMWSRYAIPIYPALAVTAGSLVSRLLVEPRRRVGIAAAALLAAAHLGLFVSLSRPNVLVDRSREHRMGMVSPETRPFSGFREAVTALSKLGTTIIAVSDHDAVMDRSLTRSGYLPELELEGLRFRIVSGQDIDAETLPRPTLVLLVRLDPNIGIEKLMGKGYFHGWLVLSMRKLVARTVDPDGIVYEAYLAVDPFRLNLRPSRAPFSIATRRPRSDRIPSSPAGSQQNLSRRYASVNARTAGASSSSSSPSESANSRGVTPAAFAYPRLASRWRSFE
jgi:hypothetical protein